METINAELISKHALPFMVVFESIIEFKGYYESDEKTIDFTKDFRIVIPYQDFIYGYILVFSPNTEKVFIFVMDANANILYQGQKLDDAFHFLKEGLAKYIESNKQV